MQYLTDSPASTAAAAPRRRAVSWWQRQLLTLAVVAVLAGFALAMRAHFPAHKVWWPAGAGIALTALWGPRVLAAVVAGSAASALWWTADLEGSLLFALEQAAVVAAACALMRWPGRIKLGLDKLSHMAAFIALGAGGYALAAAVAMAIVPESVRHVRVDLAASQRHDVAAHASAHAAAHVPAPAAQHAPAPAAAHAPVHVAPHAPAPAAAVPEAHAGRDHGAPAHGVGHAGSPRVEWALADMLGVLLVAPALWWLLQRGGRQVDTEADGPPIGALVALSLLLAIAAAIYSGWMESTFGLRHTTLLVLPPAVWLALRYPIPFTLAGNLAAVLIADIGTSLGHGPFSDHTGGLPLLHLVFAGTTLLMAASRTERTLATAQVHRLATRDTLTDLPNRNLLALRLEAALATAQRHQQRVGVLFIDLDHFKRINDSLGHAVGDQLLIAATQRITSVLRSDSTVARMGGDEFVAVMERLKDAEDPSRAASRVIAALEHPFEIGPHSLTISCSVGVANFPEDGRSGSELIKHADIAMYEAKNAGRNQFRFFSPAMNEEVRRRLEIENGLRQALQTESLELHYQPVFDAAGEQMLCVEALLRWRRADGVLVAPNEFIRIAEETGLIEGIGAWVLRRAAAQTQAWRRAGLRTVPVCVNVSARQLRNARALAEQVRQALQEHDLEGRDLVLEITESMLLHLGGEAEHSLQQLAHHGITLALDDFGTGYSSLGYLARLPIDTLKIDRSFVHAMMERDAERKLVRAVIELAHGLDMRVTAEGVETRAQHGVLQAMRADAMQGNLFCPALGPEPFAERHLQPNAQDA